MKLMRMALTGSFLLVLAGCGNNSPITDPPQNPNTPNNPGGLPGIPGLPIGPTDPNQPAGTGISGTVTAPAGGDINNAVVLACPENACGDSATQNVRVTSAGAYSFNDLSSTTQYAIYAFKDNTGGTEFANGDYFGFYTTDGTTPAPVTPPKTDVNITMTVYDDGSGTPSTPTNPGTGGSIVGTILPPGTVSGTSAVVALYLTGDQDNPFDTSLSGVAEIPVGASFDYSVDSLTAGQYLVVGLSDVDGNGSFEDATDYAGVFSSPTTPEAVSPPATDIDIPLVFRSELGGTSVQNGSETTELLEATEVLSAKYISRKQLEQTLKTLR